MDVAVIGKAKQLMKETIEPLAKRFIENLEAVLKPGSLPWSLLTPSATDNKLDYSAIKTMLRPCWRLNVESLLAAAKDLHDEHMSTQVQCRAKIYDWAMADAQTIDGFGWPSQPSKGPWRPGNEDDSPGLATAFKKVASTKKEAFRSFSETSKSEKLRNYLDSQHPHFPKYEVTCEQLMMKANEFSATLTAATLGVAESDMDQILKEVADACPVPVDMLNDSTGREQENIKLLLQNKNYG